MLSGVINMVIRYTPLPALSVRIVIIPDVFIAGRERESEKFYISVNYRYLIRGSRRVLYPIKKKE